jgi:hypothetical protein
VPAAPAASRAKLSEAHERSHHRYNQFNRLSPRNSFNGLYRALPGERIRLVTVICGLRFCQTRSGRRASANLTPATGARTTRLCRPRKSACRPHALRPLTRFMRTRPAIPARARRCRVHRIPPRVNDDGQRPSVGRDGRGYRSDLGQAGTKIFLQRGLDRANQIDPVQQNRPSAQDGLGPLTGHATEAAKSTQMGPRRTSVGSRFRGVRHLLEKGEYQLTKSPCGLPRFTISRQYA